MELPIPTTNPSLSAVAKAVWGVLATVGRPLSAKEIYESNFLTEGRGAIRKGMNELQEAGYLAFKRERLDNGTWNPYWEFTEPAKKFVDLFNWGYLPRTEDRNSDVGVSVDISTIDSSKGSLKVLRTLSLYDAQGVVKEKELDMSWSILDDDPQPKKKPKRGQIDDDVVGGIGKIVDKQALRNKKYKRTSTKVEVDNRARSERPEEEWKTGDLVAEFYSLAESKIEGIPAQINGTSLIRWINKLVGQGVPRVTVLKGMRMFFADVRNFHDLGVGLPLWQRFIAYYPTVHGLAAAAPVEYRDDEFEEHQKAMLEMLKGE